MSAGNVHSSSFSSTATAPLLVPKKFEDRSALALSWFEGWSEAKRWRFLERLLSVSSEKHLRRVHRVLEPKVPRTRVDFTRHLPHTLCLHILGQLDPKTLCRASQVCWYWRILCEDNSLWRVKCLRYGWVLPQPPSDNELGVWKRHYVMCVHNLHWIPPKTLPLGYHGDITKDDVVEAPPSEDDTDTETTVSSVFPPVDKGEEFVHHGNSGASLRRPPWRVTDRKPEELIKSTILWTSRPQKKQQNRSAPHLSTSQSVLPATQNDRSSLNRGGTSIRLSMSTPLVGGAKGRGSGTPVNDRVPQSMSAGDVNPFGDSVEENELQPRPQKGIEAWLSVRELERSELPQARNHSILRKTIPVSSQERNGGRDKLADKATPSHNPLFGVGGTADTQPSARKASVVQSSWQLSRQSKDNHPEPNKATILLKPWQPSHASHVTVLDSDVSDDESV